jgi:hypothetical protein
MYILDKNFRRHLTNFNFFQFFSMLIRSYVNKTEVISQMIETYLPNEFNERRQLYDQETTQGYFI